MQVAIIAAMAANTWAMHEKATRSVLNEQPIEILLECEVVLRTCSLTFYLPSFRKENYVFGLSGNG